MRFFPAPQLHNSNEVHQSVGKPSKVDGEVFKYLQSQVLANPLTLITQPRTQTNAQVKHYMLNQLFIGYLRIYMLPPGKIGFS